MTDVTKRILIIRNAFAYDFGGGERFPVNLAKELRGQNYEPVIISRNPKLLKFAASEKIEAKRGPWLSEQDYSGKRVALLPLYILWQAVLFIWYFGKIAYHRPAVVHPQSRDDFIAATLAGKLWLKKVVWTDHADLKYVWQNHRIWYKNPVGKLVYLASKLADHITLVSLSEKRLIENHLGRPLSDKFTVVYNGVHDKAIAPMPRSSTDKDALVFAATSRLVTAKGIGELIGAFQSIDKKIDARLWLLGEGPEEARFREMAQNNKHVSFLGFPEDALSYVAAADIFVHPSYHEGFSISLVEAAMLGKPIITCSVGGNPEIIKNGKNGVLIKERDTESLRSAMEMFANQKTLRLKYGEAARRTFEADFDFEAIVRERFLPLYEK